MKNMLRGMSSNYFTPHEVKKFSDWIQGKIAYVTGRTQRRVNK